ncbi:hypothetical protein CBFG_05556 [Clostridiales bacterium 1_7_47FAA]|nr:hypothetical protein CBFG_05556 [Clostridiales bacterium 1_7_47FAA]
MHTWTGSVYETSAGRLGIQTRKSLPGYLHHMGGYGRGKEDTWIIKQSQRILKMK